MTLSEILAAIYEETAYQSSPASAVTTRITRFVNDGVRLILSEPGLQRLADSDSPLSVASVASQARYVVPEAVAAIRRISERTNDRTLQALSLDAYRRMEPDPASTSGTPSHYVPIGKVAVAVQPADASELFVKSTAAGDTTQIAYVEGLISGGYRRTASVTLTGATAVTLSAALATFIEVEDFYVSAACTGTVTLHEDSGAGAELARITIGAKRPRYYGFYLWPTPAAVVSYLVDYRRELVDLVNAADEPPLPTDFHALLVDYGVLREFEMKDDLQRVVVAKQRFEKRLARLKYQTQWAADELPVMGRGRVLGHSRLGGFYPADTWTRG
jgi:hypothetical protein